ncbi:MAG: Fe-S cluster assembly protein SufD [Rhizomicrobium sp.]
MSAPPAAENFLPREFEPNGYVSPPPWLAPRRARALRDFQARGIPHRRVEEWKYSDLRNALEAPCDAAAEVSVAESAPDRFARIAGHRLALRDGRFDAGSVRTDALPGGIELVDLGEIGADAPDWVIRNLGHVLSGGAVGEASLALMRGGLALRVTQDVETPVHLRFLQSANAAHSRMLIVVGQGASLDLLESHGRANGLANIGFEVILEPGARMTHARLAAPAPDAIQIEEIGIRMARDSCYRGHFSQAGAKLSRLELAIALCGEGAGAELSGATVLGGKLHADVTTHIEHVAGKTASRQLFKHVAGGISRAVYQGKITVQKGADGSDSRQTAKALLLGERAEADLKPELEILADDVKCAHGAAVGELDADSLFYLRSRGLAEQDARGMLLRGFLEEAVAEIARDDVRECVWNFIEDGLVLAQEVRA